MAVKTSRLLSQIKSIVSARRGKYGDQHYRCVGDQLLGLWSVWFVKLILLERYQFMDKIGGEPIKTPYVMIRLDRLTGAGSVRCQLGGDG